MKDLDQRWIIKDFLPEGYFAILSGNSKAGKSTFLTALALSIAKGLPFLGKEVTQGSVLWMAYEESRQERGLALRPHGGLPDNLLITHEQIKVNTLEGRKVFRCLIELHNIKLLILDPMYLTTDSDSLSDGIAARKAFQEFKALLEELSVTAIFVHHLNKMTSSGMVRERVADSNQLLAIASMDILFDSKPQPDRSRQIYLRCTGRGEFANNDYVIDSKAVTDFTISDSGPTGTVDLNGTVRGILDALKACDENGISAEQIAENSGLRAENVRNSIKKLVDKGKVKRVGKTKPFLYDLA